MIIILMQLLLLIMEPFNCTQRKEQKNVSVCLKSYFNKDNCSTFSGFQVCKQLYLTVLAAAEMSEHTCHCLRGSGSVKHVYIHTYI